MALSYPVREFSLASLYLALVISMVALGACGGSKKPPESSVAANTNGEVNPISVSTAVAVSREVPAYIQATGSLTAEESSDVAPETSGQVIATPVDVGAFVKRGAVMARLDDRDARLRLQQAIAAEKQEVAAVRQAEERLGLRGGSFDASAVPEVRAAYLQYEAAEAQAKLAESNARRYSNLVETGDVSNSAYDQARAQADTARAQSNAAKQNYEVAVNLARQNNLQIAGAQAKLEAARTQVGLARKALDDTIIKAPFSGYVSDRPIAVGEYVTPSSKVVTLLFTNPIKLRLQLPEAEAARVRIGMPVRAAVVAYPGREFDGTVSALNPAVDPTSRTITVEVGIRNPDNALRSGMFATGKIVLEPGGESVFVPRSAVVSDTGTNSSTVYVIQGDTAVLKVVQAGEEDAGLVRILSGLSAGDLVATSNLDQLYDGVPVTRR